MKAFIGKNGVVSTIEQHQMWMEDINRNCILYFGCYTGLGKTCQAECLAEEYYNCWIRISAKDQPVYRTFRSWQETLRGKRARKLVIIDQISYLREGQQNVKDILRIINEKQENQSFDLIIAGRSECPSWLIYYQCIGFVKCYGKEYFLLKEEELEKLIEYELGKMAQRFGIHEKKWLKHKTKEVMSITNGYGISVSICLQLIKENADTGTSYKKKLQDLLSKYFEKTIIPNLEPKMFGCLEKISVYDFFTKEMAGALLTPEEKDILKSIFDYSCAIIKDEKGYYRMLKIFRTYAKDTYRKRDKEEYIKTAGIAGTRCEEEGMYGQALSLYTLAEDKQNMQRLFVEMVEKGEGTEFPRICRPYMQLFSEQDYKENPKLMGAKILIESYHMCVEQSNQSLDEMRKLAEAETTFGEYHKNYIRTQMALPQRSVLESNKLLGRYLKILKQEKDCSRNILLTGNGPSIINGIVDVMGWITQRQSLYTFLNQTVPDILGEEGVGLVEAGMGEYFLERNERTKAMHYLSKAVADINEKGNFRNMYAVKSVIARSFLQENKIEEVKVIMDFLVTYVRKSSYQELLPNVEATGIEMALYAGDNEVITTWFWMVQKERFRNFLQNDLVISERYQFYIMIKVYIFMHDYAEAQALIEQMVIYAEKYERTYYQIKLNLLQAILLKRIGKDGTKNLILAVKQAETYGYIRVIADEGVALISLWKKVDWKKVCKEEGVSEAFLNETEKELKMMALYYPEYLKGVEGVVLSKSEHQVMKCIYEGKQNETIAEEIGIKVSTVKFHVSNILKKLEVKNRQEAIRKVIELGWYQS